MNKTKIGFLVAGVVVMLFGLIIYATVSSKEADRKSFLAKIQDLNARVAELPKLQADLEQVKKEKTNLEVKTERDIAALEAQVSDGKKAEATYRAKIEALAKEKDSLTKFMENNNVIVAKLQKKIESLQQENKQATEDAKQSGPMSRLSDPMNDSVDGGDARPGSSGTRVSSAEIIDLGHIVMRRSIHQPAAVEHVNSLYGFIVLSAGTDDGLRKDSVVNITRNNRLIAKAVVKKVRSEVASAVTLPEWTREEIKVGDLVSVNSSSP